MLKKKHKIADFKNILSVLSDINIVLSESRLLRSQPFHNEIFWRVMSRLYGSQTWKKVDSVVSLC